MDKYEVQGTLGDGTYGVVLRATLRRTGELVAIKRMKQRFRTFDECTRLPEVIALRKLHSCPNVVRLREIFRDPSGELSLVFDFMDGDLLGVIRRHKQVGLPATRIRAMCFQIVQGLAALHKLGYFHRDMKPENILVKREGGAEIVKLADLGLVKETRARPPFTDYVSTRWYRAPEILLQDRAYNSPVDMWAMGCIMVELFTGRPLFPGANEQDQLFKIVSILGSPTTWPEGLELARKLNRRFPAISPTPVAQLFPSIPAQALDLIQRMLAWNPRQRITAQQALNHPYLQSFEGVPDATPRTQALPRVPANSAPSPHLTGPAVDWRDVKREQPAPPPTGSRAHVTPALGAPLSQVAATAQQQQQHQQQQQPQNRAPASHFGGPSNKPAGSVDVLSYAAGGYKPPQQQQHSPLANDISPPPRQVGGPSGLPPLGGGSSANRNAVPSSQSAAYAPSPSVRQPPPSAGRGAGAGPVAKGQGAANPLRDSFEHLFKAAGIDIDELLANLDKPIKQTAPPPGAAGSRPPVAPAAAGPTTSAPSSAVGRPRDTQIGGAGVTPERSGNAATNNAAGSGPRDAGGPPRSPISIGGGLPMSGNARRGNGASPLGASPDPLGAHVVLHGRRKGSGSLSPANRGADEIENLQPGAASSAAVGAAPGSGAGGRPTGESPLARLLLQSRYRTGNAPAPLDAGCVAGPSSQQPPATFKSPSFARRPTPLSVSSLQQQRVTSGVAGGSTLEAALQNPAGAGLSDDATYRQLFRDIDGGVPQSIAARHVALGPHADAASAAAGAAAHHHHHAGPLRAVRGGPGAAGQHQQHRPHSIYPDTSTGASPPQ